MINIESLVSAMQADSRLASWAEILPAQIEKVFTENPHGDLPRWEKILDALIKIKPSSLDLNSNAVRIGSPGDLSPEQQQELISQLKEFMPWRKGPFDLFGINIETEWHSDWKWNRFKDYIQPLKGRTILDVGCGNGYYALRMLGAGAKQVIGIDPSMYSVMQYQVLQHFTGEQPACVLPLGIDDVPSGLEAFDTVFSLGVLYHRKEPLEHVRKLQGLLRKGGELVLETLVIEGDENAEIKPKDRYAMMRNVHAIPSCKKLEHWLEAEGFNDIRIVDVTLTTTDEQRATEWMVFQSLKDFLDPDDNSKTVEGYPAPVRAVVIAKK